MLELQSTDSETGFGRQLLKIMDSLLFYSETVCSHNSKSILSKNTILFSKRCRHDDRWHFPCCNINTSPYATGGSTKKFIQFSGSVMSDTLWPRGLQHARFPCPSLTPRAYSNSCPSHWWCHPAISFSVIPFSFCLQTFPASGSFPMSWFFALGGQSIEISASASVLPLGLTGWISLQSKGPSRVFSHTTVQKHQFFSTQLSL